MRLLQMSVFLLSTSLVACQGRPLYVIAAEATPSINELLAAGKANDVAAGLKAFATGARNEATLKTLFAADREVWTAAQPLLAKDSSYSSVSGGSAFLPGTPTHVEARVPGVPGRSLRADIVDDGGWKIRKFEFFRSP